MVSGSRPSLLFRLSGWSPAPPPLAPGPRTGPCRASSPCPGWVVRAARAWRAMGDQSSDTLTLGRLLPWQTFQDQERTRLSWFCSLYKYHPLQKNTSCETKNWLVFGENTITSMMYRHFHTYFQWHSVSVDQHDDPLASPSPLLWSLGSGGHLGAAESVIGVRQGFEQELKGRRNSTDWAPGITIVAFLNPHPPY